MRPRQSYSIWFTQRTGSTLLCKTLEDTGLVGKPAEYFTSRHHEMAKLDVLEDALRYGTTPNGWFGVKLGTGPWLQQWFVDYAKNAGLPEGLTRPQIWEHAFPNHKYIFMTRRNRVRLAVSWWRAIVSDEWHRVSGEKPAEADLADKYNYDAISHLLNEVTMRDAAIEDFFAEGDIAPLTIVYEDFIRDYEGTVRRVLDYLGEDADGVEIAPPYYDKLADETAEAWVQRYRAERQADWDNKMW